MSARRLLKKVERAERVENAAPTQNAPERPSEPQAEESVDEVPTVMCPNFFLYKVDSSNQNNMKALDRNVKVLYNEENHQRKDFIMTPKITGIHHVALKAVGTEEYEIVVANILADVLVPLTPVILHQLKPGGIYITSGIIDDKEETVVNCVKAAGLEVLEVTYQGEWVSVTAKKH